METAPEKTARLLREAQSLPSELAPGTPERARMDAALVAAIEACPAAERAAFIRRYVKRQTVVEIVAASPGLDPAKVQALCTRALSLIRAHMEANGAPDV